MSRAEKKQAIRARHANRAGRAGSMNPVDRALIDGACTPEQITRGDMHVTDFKMIETVIGGKIKTHTARAIRNFNNTAVDRWQRAGEIDDRQMAAILYYQRNWNIRHGEQRTTANWGAFISGGGGDGGVSPEDQTHRELNAKANLRFLDDTVFLHLPVGDLATFRDVVLFDVAAGVAGLTDSHRTKPRAEGRCLQIVQSVAHQIASAVIDGRRGNDTKRAA